MSTKIFPLSEGTFTVGRDKMFAPFHLDEHELNDRPTGSLLVEVQPFLVVNDRDVLLFDTGLGFKNPSGVLQLTENLAKHNVHPEDVTKILLSHLHKDHAGGLAHILSDDAFHNAKIYIYFPELEFAFEKGAPSYMTEDFNHLRHHPNVVWLEGKSGDIDGYIHYEHTGGHSPQHIVYWVDAEDKKLFFGGDEAPQYKQMIVKYVAKYDFDGKKAMELREKWAEQARAEGWHLMFYHDVKNPTHQIF